MRFVSLITDRFDLQLFNESHAEPMFDGLTDSRAYEHLDENPPGSLGELKNRYSNLSVRERLDIQQHWINWVIVSKGSGNCLGYVQATAKLREREILVAYHVFPQFWRTGVATEAVGRMLRFLEESYPQFVKIASIDPGNASSIALIEKMGFERRFDTNSSDLIYSR